MNPWKRILAIFKEQSEEKPATYLLELDKVCLRFAFVLAVMSIFIWIRYIPIDKSIFPEIYWMPYVRYGLISLGIFILLVSLFFKFRYQGIILMSVLAGYYIIGAGVLAGVAQGRSIYFAGYIVSILVVLFVPLPKIINYFVTYGSLFAFGIFAYLTKFDLGDQENAFMVSLCVNVTILSSVFIFILDRSRRRSYLKSKEIENRIREIEYQKNEIETLSQFSKTLNEEQDIDRVLEKVFQYITKTYDIDYIWLNMVSEDKKSIYSYKFRSSVELPEESEAFMNSFRAELVESTGTFFMTYNKKKAFYLSRNIEDFLVSDTDIKITQALNLKGFLIVPLMIQNEVIALISFTNYNSVMNLDKQKREEIIRFCDQIAGALNTSKILQDLNKSLQNLKESQAQLIQSEKMAGLGQIVASVAHEMNTPLGAIKASAENLRFSWKQFLDQTSEHYFQSMIKKGERIQSINHFLLMEENNRYSTKEVRKAKKSMLETLLSHGVEEGRASRVVDDLAEVGIVEVGDDLIQLLNHPHGEEFLHFITVSRGITMKHENIISAADRTAKIVSALKTFSHRDNEGKKTLYSLKDGIQTILTIFSSLIRQGIEVEENIDSVPRFYAYSDELNQVWTNLLHNSIQAMNNQGRIEIGAKVLSEGGKDWVEITFQDNGPGIPPEIQEKIFQAFFTTKPAGEGSGLGLHITKQIIDRHEGSIRWESKPGETKFLVTLPIS